MNTMETDVEKTHGFGWILAAVFIVGETAGSGLVAVPNAIVNTGALGGSILLLLLCILLAYTAIMLGNNWILMTRLWPKYRNHCRDPYPEMARRALGEPARILTRSLIYATLFGAVAVFSLLAAKNVSQLLTVFDLYIQPCVLLLVVALLIWPVMMLRSPMSFWQVSIGAAASTTCAVILLIAGISFDFQQCSEMASHPLLIGNHFSLGFGTMVFAYGGHPCFPTIQHDMKTPELFHRAVFLGYMVLFLLYTPVALLAFGAYGDSMTDSVIPSIQLPWIRNIINVLVTIHVLTSIVIIANPLHQGAEHLTKVPHEFGWKRFFVRSVIYWSAIFTAASLPNFGIFLDLVGSSSMTLLCIVLPSIYSLFLECTEEIYNRGKPSEAPKRATLKEVISNTPKQRLLLEVIVIGFGLICGITATINAVKQLTTSELATPCYIQIFRESAFESSASSMQCCGVHRNVSLYNNQCTM